MSETKTKEELATEHADAQAAKVSFRSSHRTERWNDAYDDFIAGWEACEKYNAQAWREIADGLTRAQAVYQKEGAKEAMRLGDMRKQCRQEEQGK